MPSNPLSRRAVTVPARPSRDAAAAARPGGTMPIGVLARRAGVAASALRFYEARGLIAGARSGSGRRHYRSDVLRRVAFIRVAQSVGLSLDEIAAALGTLPGQRTPTAGDWARLSASWKPMLQVRIDALTALRDKLDGCIGCGCLSLKTCALYNAGDRASRLGSGPRYLLGDRPTRDR